jgi:hypothetical protein
MGIFIVSWVALPFLSPYSPAFYREFGLDLSLEPFPSN